jgi:hypothetical protein
MAGESYGVSKYLTISGEGERAEKGRAGTSPSSLLPCWTGIRRSRRLGRHRSTFRVCSSVTASPITVSRHFSCNRAVLMIQSRPWIRTTRSYAPRPVL